MATYYTLVCREKGSSRWSIQFGDYDRPSVAEEQREMRRDWPRGTQWKIVKSADNQTAVEAAIRQLGQANPGSRGRKRTAGRTKIGAWWDSMDSTLAIYWGAQDLEAHFRLSGAEEVLDWLKIDPARVRADKSTTFSVSMLDLTTLLRPWRGGR
jgi:hypothetical protein